MIRLAFLAVLVIAGALAFGGFSLMRNTGGSTAQPAAAPAVEPAAAADPAVPTVVEKASFLADQDFGVGRFALILHRAGPEGQDMVVVDIDALNAAQQNASVDPNFADFDTQISDDAGALEQRIATLYRDGNPTLALRCLAQMCDLTDDTQFEFAGLMAAAQPLLRIDETFENYDTSLDAVAFVTATPEYAFLDLRADGGIAHPAPQQTPTASMVLPTIYRFADAPLNVETHTAVLSAVLTEALPDGTSVTDLTITRHDPAVLIELETGRPATRAGVPITFDDVVLYTPRFEVEGTATLSEETLEALTEDTLLRVDWEQAAEDFVASLGLPCPTCFGVQAVGDVANRANVTDAAPERYTLSYYDLREAP